MPKFVSLWSDYSGWPLWDEEGGTGPEHWPKLSERLRTDLVDWEDYWAGHFHHSRGWDDPESEAQYRREGERLEAELQRQPGPDYDVTMTV